MGATGIQEDQFPASRRADVMLSVRVDRQKAMLSLIGQNQIHLCGADIHFVFMALGVPCLECLNISSPVIQTWQDCCKLLQQLLPISEITRETNKIVIFRFQNDSRIRILAVSLRDLIVFGVIFLGPT